MRRTTCKDMGHVYRYGYGSEKGRITHLQVESDSNVLVDIVTGKCFINENALIRRIHDLKKELTSSNQPYLA
jgi:hypothetical protein